MAPRFLGKNCVPFRGHCEKFDPENPNKCRGVFFGAIDMVSVFDPKIKKFYNDLNAGQASGSKDRSTMFSPMIQNEYVNLFGKKILKELVKDVIESEFYTIISDKVTVHSRQ